MKQLVIVIFAALTVAASALLISCGSQSSGGTTAQAATAPGFKLENVAGGTVDFSNYKGKVVLVDFWATWCPPCRRSIPDLADLHKKLSGRGFEVVGISLDNIAKDSVASFARSFQIPYTILMGNPDVAMRWNIGRSIPVAILVNRDGAVVDKVVGYKDAQYWEQKIAQYL